MDFNLRIPVFYVMVLALAGALLDFCVMGYWIGIFHHYDPGAHSPVIGSYSEFTFGAGAMARYTQLIIASYLCLLTHAAAGLGIKLKIKGFVQKMFILALCARAFWFYVETRQMLISARTVVRREQEVKDWINSPLLPKQQKLALLDEKSPPKPLVRFFNPECFQMDKDYLKQYKDNNEQANRNNEDNKGNSKNNNNNNNDDDEHAKRPPPPQPQPQPQPPPSPPEKPDPIYPPEPEGDNSIEEKRVAGNVTKTGEVRAKPYADADDLKSPPTPESCNFEYELPLWDAIFISFHLLLSVFVVSAFAVFLGNGADIGPEQQVFPEKDPAPSVSPTTAPGNPLKA